MSDHCRPSIPVTSSPSRLRPCLYSCISWTASCKSCFAPHASRKGLQQPTSPFAGSSYQRLAKQQQPSCNGGWQPPGAGHSRCSSYGGTPSPSHCAGSQLLRAASAPEGYMQHFLDRNFMATVQMQSRLVVPAGVHVTIDGTHQLLSACFIII